MQVIDTAKVVESTSVATDLQQKAEERDRSPGAVVLEMIFYCRTSQTCHWPIKPPSSANEPYDS
jgi:hypothetical protein